MPRTARSVVEGVPYHVTQRGNRRQDIFFCDEDRRIYLSWLADYCDRYKLEVLSYCLMTNHDHVVTVPHSSDSLAKTFHILHTRYSRMINERFSWCGHLFQGRYFSTALDDAHLYAAVRYVERNPVRVGMVERAEDYPWSSAAFHLGLRKNDPLIRSKTIWGGAVEGWQSELELPEDEGMLEMIRKRTVTGVPCGDEGFIQRLSEILGRPLIPGPRGRPRKNK